MSEPGEQRERAPVLGLIAGAGALPVCAARLLESRDEPFRVFGFEGLTDPDLARAARCTRLGQLGAMRGLLAAAKVAELLIVGRFPKATLLANPELLSPDEEALALLARGGDWDDDGLQGMIADWLEAEHFRVARQDELLAPLLAQTGRLSRRAPSEAERADFEAGRRAVLTLGRAGIGQCVATRRGCVLAVEAVEGTDAMTRRAGALGGSGATIVKAARPGQDRRFDLPTIGPGTIASMRDAGATALAVEAGATLVVDRSRLIAAADAAAIAVWGFEADPGASESGR
jgi:DUF1009 family protein